VGTHPPEHPSTAAAAHLPPAFPERAAWGTAGALRAWQQDAITTYLSRERRDFLTAATPGAGKTTFALRVATELLARRTVERLIVVCPTEHLKTQWADAAARVGIRLDPTFRNSDPGYAAGYDGVVVTYAQVGLKPQAFAGAAGRDGRSSCSTRSTTRATRAAGARASRSASRTRRGGWR
jgi:superfamily II DNA or RNA helicase